MHPYNKDSVYSLIMRSLAIQHNSYCKLDPYDSTFLRLQNNTDYKCTEINQEILGNQSLY